MKKPDWRNPKDYLYLEKLKPNQWAWEFLRRNTLYKKDWHKYKNDADMLLKLSFKWSINGLLRDPSKQYADIVDDPDGIGFDPPGGAETVLMNKTNKELEYLHAGLPNFETGEQNFCFNFNLPIEPQLKTAKKMLLKLQKRAGGRRAFKPRCAEWTTLIRVYDAKREKVSSTEILKALSSESGNAGYNLQTIYDKYKQAKKFIENDYRLIPFHNNYEE